MNRRDVVCTAAVFLAIFGFLWLAHANRLLLTNDEGIYLDAGQRIHDGQKPYVDFWAYMSPPVMWHQALAFRIAGVTQRGGRLPVIFFFALQCALVFAFATLLASRLTGLIAALFYFAFTGAHTTFITAQHRWDSGAFILLGILLAVLGAMSARASLLAFAGACMAYAAVTTPSMGLLCALTLGWLVVMPERRRLALWFLGGGVAIGVVVLAAMMAGGYLGGFFEQMQWLSRKYSGVNRMPYGSIIGGYGALFAAPSVGERIVNGLIVFFIALPAILPIFASAGWAFSVISRRTFHPRDIMTYLVLCIPCLAATAYPRADVEHLAFIVPLAYVLAAALLYHRYDGGYIMPLVLFFGTGAALFLFFAWSPILTEQRITSPIGHLRSVPADASHAAALLQKVKPNDSLYVHPYLPLFYFLTQARNPTRYSYMAPGMMDEEDERLVFDALERRPPQWILFLELSLEEFKRVFPAGDPARLRFQKIETWIRTHYKPSGLNVSGYQLLERK